MLSEGRGQGVLATYMPWLRVSRGDFSSSGVSSIVPDPLVSHRPHHTFSRGETALLLRLLYSHPFDVREQFPLARFPEEHPLLRCGLPLSVTDTLRLALCRGTVALAAALGIRHPRYPQSRTPFVMTTDFLVTTIGIDDKPQLTAFSYKPRRKLVGGPRVLELLELERRAWAELGVAWRLVTEEHLNVSVSENLLWAHRYCAEVEPWAPNPVPLRPRFLEQITCGQWDIPVRDALRRIAGLLRWPFELAVALFRHCLWRREIIVDLETRIELPRVLSQPPVVRVGDDASPSKRKGDDA